MHRLLAGEEEKHKGGGEEGISLEGGEGGVSFLNWSDGYKSKILRQLKHSVLKGGYR